LPEAQPAREATNSIQLLNPLDSNFFMLTADVKNKKALLMKRKQRESHTFLN
jgi:hypothetical protein